MNLFYTPDISGDTWMLPEDESKHVIKVLRLKRGDLIHLTDGKGNLYTSNIKEDHPKRCLLSITETHSEFGKRDYFVQIAIAPTKNSSRFEWFLEKSTEIGVDIISPIICQRSERRQIKTDRLNRVITSAMKQSLKAYHPVLEEQQGLGELMNSPLPAERYIAHCGTGERHTLKSLVKPGRSSIVLIGPEGDFSPEEIELAISKGFTPVSLGDSRLRTETAGIAAVHTVSLVNQ